MDFFTSLLGLLGQIGGGVAGQLAGQPDQAQALAMLNAAKDAYGNIDVPKLQQLMNQQAPSQMQGISTDPRLRQAQMDALTQMQDLGKSGGLNLSDKAALNDVNTRLARTEAANRQAVQQSLQARGLDSSGAELALSQKGAQDAAQNANARGLGIAGQAQQRSLEAMMGAGRLGGQMESQQFGEQAAKAQAQDAINRYNTSIQNAAAQTQFGDELQKAGGLSGQLGGLSGYYQNQAQAQRNLFGGIGQGVGQAFNAYGAQQRNQAPQTMPSYAPQPNVGSSGYYGATNYGASSPDDWLPYPG